MKKNDTKQLKILLIKYQLIYFGTVLCLSLVLLFGYSKIQYLLAQNLFKTNMNELLIQDFRTVILNLDQFVPSQFVAIDLVRNGHVILTTGSRENSILNLDNEFKTIDQTSLIFSSSYQLIVGIIGIFIFLSLLASRFINKYFSHSYERQILNEVELHKSKLLYEISKKVAHDIRSPLSTLNMLAATIENSEVREIQKAVTKQIDRIASDLLNFTKGREIDSDLTFQSIKQIFSQIKKECELHSIDQNYQISFEDELYSDVRLPNLTVLYQNINNFIQNSIEARAKNIKIILRQDESIQIAVIDDGDGMDKKTLSSVGKIEYSTKSGHYNSGNGIALLNAKKSAMALGWKMQIESSLGIGTAITITIPFK